MGSHAQTTLRPSALRTVSAMPHQDSTPSERLGAGPGCRACPLGPSRGPRRRDLAALDARFEHDVDPGGKPSTSCASHSSRPACAASEPWRVRRPAGQRRQALGVVSLTITARSAQRELDRRAVAHHLPRLVGTRARVPRPGGGRTGSSARVSAANVTRAHVGTPPEVDEQHRTDHEDLTAGTTADSRPRAARLLVQQRAGGHGQTRPRRSTAPSGSSGMSSTRSRKSGNASGAASRATCP